ncbi:uncharacterized protein N7482_006654 [Penicillium canariense]|uniref:Uncharacterized protein n=1 Tax=Penicillium canariense TaxID=189055 RepID=A0A9W9LJ57_9EURO|nr:uncharacterized protein N7482_006654 [Penicillium canariense]KAJ5159650.1 hypothetical protein N7482_006654 [Penicillium canariense]
MTYQPFFGGKNNRPAFSHQAGSLRPNQPTNGPGPRHPGWNGHPNSSNSRSFNPNPSNSGNFNPNSSKPRKFNPNHHNQRNFSPNSNPRNFNPNHHNRNFNLHQPANRGGAERVSTQFTHLTIHPNQRKKLTASQNYQPDSHPQRGNFHPRQNQQFHQPLRPDQQQVGRFNSPKHGRRHNQQAHRESPVSSTSASGDSMASPSTPDSSFSPGSFSDMSGDMYGDSFSDSDTDSNNYYQAPIQAGYQDLRRVQNSRVQPHRQRNRQNQVREAIEHYIFRVYNNPFLKKNLLWAQSIVKEIEMPDAEEIDPDIEMPDAPPLEATYPCIPDPFEEGLAAMDQIYLGMLQHLHTVRQGYNFG